MGSGRGGSGTPTQVVNPDRNATLTEGQRVTDNLLADYTLAMMRGAEGNYNRTPMQLYPLHNYNPTYIPQFNPTSYSSFFGSGYGPQSFNTMPQPFGLRSAGRPYMSSPMQSQGFPSPYSQQMGYPQMMGYPQQQQYMGYPQMGGY